MQLIPIFFGKEMQVKEPKGGGGGLGLEGVWGENRVRVQMEIEDRWEELCSRSACFNDMYGVREGLSALQLDSTQCLYAMLK